MDVLFEGTPLQSPDNHASRGADDFAVYQGKLAASNLASQLRILLKAGLDAPSFYEGTVAARLSGKMCWAFHAMDMTGTGHYT